ncbi:MAG: DUF2142 domain-containing protein [Brotaphodocola sp.]
MMENKLRCWLRILMLFMLAALAMFHYLDVRAGVLESGHNWLVSRYGLVTAVVLLSTALFGYLLLEKKWRLERVFVLTALILGILYSYVLPPVSAPDEMRHYISAYQLSNRMLGLPAWADDGEGGKKVPIREEDWFTEDSCGDFDAFLTADGALATDADGADGAKILGQTLTEETYLLIHEKGLNWEDPRIAENRSEAADMKLSEGTATAAKVTMEYGSGTALSNHHPVVTTPLAYLMPAFGITLARLIGLNSLGLLALGRFFNLLLFTASGHFAIKKLPFGKELLFGTALLPAVLTLSASFSYDAFILSGMFAFTAYCLYLAYEAERVSAKDVLALALMMAAVGPCKMVYTVFMGLCLLIPVKKFDGWGKWAVSALCVLAAWGIAMVLVNRQTVVSYAAETENYIDWAGEAGYSLTQLIHQPVRCVQLFLNTVMWQLEYWHMTLIGAYLGNIDTVLDVPYLLVAGFTVGLFLLALRKPGDNLILVGGKRIWLWFLCLLCAGAILFSMLLAWTPISSRIICGVQGRYFLPFLPIILMTVKNDFVVLTRNRDREILYLMCCANGYVLMRIFSIVCMRL